MSRHWWNPFDGMEELTFRPVEGGFIYAAPNMWVFGRKQHYVVNAQQKAALASVHRKMMQYTFWSIVIAAATCGPLVGVFLPSQSNLQQLAFLGISLLVGVVIAQAVVVKLIGGRSLGSGGGVAGRSAGLP